MTILFEHYPPTVRESEPKKRYTRLKEVNNDGLYSNWYIYLIDDWIIDGNLRELISSKLVTAIL